jgi:hypothetical protein
MSPEEFVRALRVVAVDNLARSLPEYLEHPSGRRPPQQIQDLSTWFNRLTPDDRERLVQVVRLTADRAAGTVLMAIDGLVAVEASEAKGGFRLHHVRNGEDRILNEANGEALSALFDQDRKDDLS